MAAEVKKEIQLEIAHVLFIDIVSYSRLLITEQSEQLQTLKEIVRATEQFRIAEATCQADFRSFGTAAKVSWERVTSGR